MTALCVEGPGRNGKHDSVMHTVYAYNLMGPHHPLTADQVVHGGSNDVCWLQRDFRIYMVNVFDTEKACQVRLDTGPVLQYAMRAGTNAHSGASVRGQDPILDRDGSRYWACVWLLAVVVCQVGRIG